MRSFTIELTTTQQCNFRCEYCFENDFDPNYFNFVKDNLNLIIQQIRSLKSSSWFKDKYDSIQISFWGGEPALEYGIIEKVVKEFKNDDDVYFFIYTNGSKIRQLMKSILILKDLGKTNFTVQVSYDGLPIHDIVRKPKDGKQASTLAKKAMQILSDNQIPFHPKATIQYKHFKYIPEVWDDFLKLHTTISDRIGYFVTPDYHNIEFYKYKDEIEKALIDISRKEYKFFKYNKKFLSNLFSDRKALCSFGDMITIDINGDCYICHGTIYSKDQKDFKVTNINSETFVNDIEKMTKIEFSNLNPIECDNCVAIHCIRCSIKKYEDSKKDNFLEKLCDYSNDVQFCDYYKLVGRIGRALHSLLRMEEK